MCELEITTYNNLYLWKMTIVELIKKNNRQC